MSEPGFSTQLYEHGRARVLNGLREFVRTFHLPPSAAREAMERACRLGEERGEPQDNIDLIRLALKSILDDEITAVREVAG